MDTLSHYNVDNIPPGSQLYRNKHDGVSENIAKSRCTEHLRISGHIPRPGRLVAHTHTHTHTLLNTRARERERISHYKTSVLSRDDYLCLKNVIRIVNF